MSPLQASFAQAHTAILLSWPHPWWSYEVLFCCFGPADLALYQSLLGAP